MNTKLSSSIVPCENGFEWNVETLYEGKTTFKSGVCETLKRAKREVQDHSFILTDGGGSGSIKRVSNDCAVRSLTLFMSEGKRDSDLYGDVFDLLNDEQVKLESKPICINGGGVMCYIFERILSRLGIGIAVEKQYRTRKWRPSINDMIKQYPNSIVDVGDHLFAVVDGMIHDKYNPNGTTFRFLEHDIAAINPPRVDRVYVAKGEL